VVLLSCRGGKRTASDGVSSDKLLKEKGPKHSIEYVGVTLLKVEAMDWDRVMIKPIMNKILHRHC